MGILLNTIPKSTTMINNKEQRADEIKAIAEACGIYKYIQGEKFVQDIIDNDSLTESMDEVKSKMLSWLGMPQNEIIQPVTAITKKPGEFYFENEEDKTMGIETCDYENGSKVKRCTLSDGRIAISRRLKGKDRLLIKRLIGDQKERMEDAVTALSTKIDDKEIVFEDIDNLWFNDAMAIQTMATMLNFM